MMASRQITQLLYSILIGISALLSGLGQSQAEYDITSEEPLYTFGDRIEFSATIFPALYMYSERLMLRTGSS